MKVGEEGAAQEHYTFRVTAMTLRNKNSLADTKEAEFLRAFERDPGLKEQTYVDKEHNALWVMRPVHLSEGCLRCHGDPSTSPWGNGKDVLGYTMENMKDGDLKGMFKIVTEMDPLDKNVSAAMSTVVMWGGGFLLLTVVGAVAFVGARLGRFMTSVSTCAGSLRTVGERVGESPTQLRANSEGIAQCASEQATALEETAASLASVSETPLATLRAPARQRRSRMPSRNKHTQVVWRWRR
jgi:methyl-accepting chemotaxis protein